MKKLNKTGIIVLTAIGGVLLAGVGGISGYFIARGQYDKKSEEYKGYLSNTSYDYLAAALAFQLSGECKALIQQAYALATNNIASIIEKANDTNNTEYYYTNVDGVNKLMHNGVQVSIISDIDDTLVDGARYSCNILGNNGDFNNSAFARFLLSDNCKALDGAVDFTNYCSNNGIEVFYVTNRYDQAYKVGQKDSYSSYEETIKNDGVGKYIDSKGNVVGSTLYQQYGKTMYDISYESMKKLGFPIDYNHLFMNDLKLNGSSKEYLRKSIQEGNTSVNNGQRSDGCSLIDSPTSVSVSKNDVVMYLGDNLGDFSDEFANCKDAVERSELISKYSSKWGKEWIVFPNAVYGDWLNFAKSYPFSQLFKDLDYTNSK
jgi:predicted secreted acid phosphatase